MATQNVHEFVQKISKQLWDRNGHMLDKVINKNICNSQHTIVENILGDNGLSQTAMFYVRVQKEHAAQSIILTMYNVHLNFDCFANHKGIDFTGSQNLR